MGTDSLELTNQGSFPLVLGVLPILHLISFAISQIVIQKSIALFFSFRLGDGRIRSGVFGVRGMVGVEMGYYKSRGAHAGLERAVHSLFISVPRPQVSLAHPTPSLQQTRPSSALPCLGPRQQPPGALLAACLPFPSLPSPTLAPLPLFIFPNWRPTPAAPQCAPRPAQQILRKTCPAPAQPQPPGGEGPGRAQLPLSRRWPSGPR